MLLVKNKKLFLLVAVLPALFFQIIGAYFYYIYPGIEFPKVIYAITKIFLIVWPISCWLLIGKFDFIKTEKKLKTSFSWGLISGLIFFAIVLAVYFLGKNYFQQFSPLILAKVQSFNLTGSNYLIFALFLSLIHSAIEEYYWRSFVFRGLLGVMKFRLALIIGGLGFALHHYLILSQFFPLSTTIIFGTLVGVAGAWWSYIYFKTNSIWGSWISHVLADMAVMTVGYMLIF